jgi:hypothetical protein
VADHDDHNLLTACLASTFLLPEIGIQSDHGWSDVASCSHGNLLDAYCILGNLGPKAASSLRSSSKRRKGSASATPDLVVLHHGATDSSPVDACTCSVAFAT